MPKLKVGTVAPTLAEDKAITTAARRDQDAIPLTDAQWKAAKPSVRMGRPPKADRKESVKLRLDPDLLEALRATGDGWQTRVNDTLRANMQLTGKLSQKP